MTNHLRRRTLALCVAACSALMLTRSSPSEHIPLALSTPVATYSHSVALGDSTVALGNGHIITDSSPCIHERHSWPDRLGISNFGCSGHTSTQTLSMLDKHAPMTEGTHTVFLTTGSNDAKTGATPEQITQRIVRLIKAIAQSYPLVSADDIYLVGYTTVSSTCADTTSRRDMSQLRALNAFHRTANTSLQRAADATGAHFIAVDTPFVHNCVSNPYSMIRLPGQSSGLEWHTTEWGTHYIAHTIHAHLSRHATQ